ncbi:YaeQ family protein [Gallaecimonas sp. GXIMD4217]|uniref:YaeQ family protein n=1 Tax=Gallaecimonas sp. GXIMD4217 TaxID=3131927 RepID=UPI00311AC864
MALGATIYKAKVNISDLDRHYYADHALTLACHPSETEKRLMLRLLAFLLHAHEDLQFTKGLCADDEPDLWQQSLSGEIELWIDLGLPDERRIKKALGRSKQVVLLTYGDRAFGPWWQKQQAWLEGQKGFSLLHVADDQAEALAALAQRNMELQCTLSDGELWLSAGELSVHVKPERLI